MQQSHVVRIDTEIDNSESKTFKKSFTKIDMLADCNIDIDYSAEDKDQILKDLSLKDSKSRTMS